MKVSPVSFFNWTVTSVKVTSVTDKSPLKTPAPVGLRLIVPASPSKSKPSAKPSNSTLEKTPCVPALKRTASFPVLEPLPTIVKLFTVGFEKKRGSELLPISVL